MNPAAHPLPKHERVRLILKLLQASPPASSREEALALMDGVFRKVEDAHSGVPCEPYNPERMYPPTAEMEMPVEGRPFLRRYRHTGHYTLIGNNGAIQIRRFLYGTVDGKKKRVGEAVDFDKPGADGGRIPGVNT